MDQVRENKARLMVFKSYMKARADTVLIWKMLGFGIVYQQVDIKGL